MRRFKFVSALIASSLVLALVTGFTTSTTSSLTFDVSTGDSVTVALDTSGGHKLVEEDGEFIVQQDGKTILQGSFLTQEGYDEQEAAIDRESVEVIEEAMSTATPTCSTSTPRTAPSTSCSSCGSTGLIPACCLAASRAPRPRRRHSTPSRFPLTPSLAAFDLRFRGAAIAAAPLCRQLRFGHTMMAHPA